MNQNKGAKDFRELEKILLETADAAGKVAAVLENPEHTEDDLNLTMALFIVQMLKIQAVGR